MEPGRHSESGFTMIEVLVAILIVSIASMATFGLLSDATRNAQRAKASQVAVEYAEQEMEYLRSLNNKQLALTTAPSHSSNTQSPNYRVSETTFALNRSPVSNYRNLVINGGSIYGGGEIEGGVISPGPTPFNSGDVSGRVYRYIVWHNDESCAEATCPGKQDYKQIIIVVKLNKTVSLPAETGYFEVQSNFIDPKKNAERDPLPGAGGAVVTAQQFFLSDTPCSSTGVTVRQEILANHPLHNTLGECSQGPQTGSTPGAPDALLLGSPPDPAPEDPTIPLAYQYSNDLYTETGLQLIKEETNGCINEPGGTNPASQMHRWVTDPMAEEFKLTGKVTLEIFTRTLNESTYNAGICLYLFDRHKTATGFTTKYFKNILGATEFWSIPTMAWPKTWTSVRRTFELSAAAVIPKGDRLGFAISVERIATQSAKAISVMYDHPNYPSRIEVDTSTPINAAG